jgi:hypothetical protein
LALMMIDYRRFRRNQRGMQNGFVWREQRIALLPRHSLKSDTSRASK